MLLKEEFLITSCFGRDIVDYIDLNIKGGYVNYDWEPGFDTKPEYTPFIEQGASGLTATSLYAELNFANLNIAKYSYETSNSKKREEIEYFDTHKEDIIDVNQISYGLSSMSLGTLIDYDDYNPVLYWLYRVFLSYEYFYDQRTYTGSVTPQSDIYYVNNDTTTPLYKSVEVKYQTTYTYKEQSIDLFGGMLSEKVEDIYVHDFWVNTSSGAKLDLTSYLIYKMLFVSPQLRIGKFEMDYSRPSAFAHDQYANNLTPIIVQADYASKGYFIALRRANRSISGFNFDLTYRWSDESEISSPIELDKEYTYNHITADMWWNIHFAENLALQFGLLLDAIRWEYKNEPEDGSIDSDQFFKYYASFGYNF